jgi:hypothetical protein
MRRSIGLIAVVSVLAALAMPVRSAAPSAMACCRGGAAMACCLPGAECAVRSCPPVDRAEAVLPGLPPAILAAAAAAPRLLLSLPAATFAGASPRVAFLSPPEEPPRG